jgi:hypothetical protein
MYKLYCFIKKILIILIDQYFFKTMLKVKNRQKHNALHYKIHRFLVVFLTIYDHEHILFIIIG